MSFSKYKMPTISHPSFLSQLLGRVLIIGNLHRMNKCKTPESNCDNVIVSHNRF
jgi:hypothetical protein